LNPAVPQDARIIQTRLTELGFYELPIDGIWGKGSRTALMAFKEENSLGSSDTWDDETQTLLLRETKPTGDSSVEPGHHPISSGSIILNPSEPSDAKKIQARLADLGSTRESSMASGVRAPGGAEVIQTRTRSQESVHVGQRNPDAPVSRNRPVRKRICFFPWLNLLQNDTQDIFLIQGTWISLNFLCFMSSYFPLFTIIIHSYLSSNAKPVKKIVLDTRVE